MGKQKITEKDLKTLKYRTLALERDCLRLGRLEKTGDSSNLADSLRKRVEQESQHICNIIDFIAGIKDERVRLAVAMRYIDGERWSAVAAVYSPSCSDSCVRMAVKRYLTAEGVSSDGCDNRA